MSQERHSERRYASKPRREQPEEKKINVEQVISYLSHTFSRAAQKMAPVIGTRNTKGTKLYEYQVEFCYLMNEIQRGPTYILPKIIQDANQLIMQMEREIKEETEQFIEHPSN